MNRSNKEMLPPHLEVRFLHAQMILELVMHIAYGDLDLNPNSLAMFGLRYIFLRCEIKNGPRAQPAGQAR
jgi:hypothetical protein